VEGMWDGVFCEGVGWWGFAVLACDGRGGMENAAVVEWR